MQKCFRALLFVLLALTIPLKAEIASKRNPEVLSLSAAMVDHLFMVSEQELKTITNETGTWAPIDYPTLCGILESNPSVSKMVPGGSGVNVLKGLAQLNHACSVIGKIGSDEKGEFVLRGLKKLGIETLFQKGNLPTGQALCFITPDAQRTFRSYLGASHSLADMKIDPKIFEGVKIFHIEGYQLVDRDLVVRALKQAKKSGLKISMNLSNVEIVRRHKDFLKDILSKYVDMVFCNESEAKALTNFSSKRACTALSSYCEVAVVTMSDHGCWTQKGKTLFYSPAFAVNAVDRTGASDLFVSGFLHGLLNDEPLQKCAWIACLVSSYVVKMVGAEIPDPVWDEIKLRMTEECPF